MSTAPFLAPHRDAAWRGGRAVASGGTNYYTIPGVTLASIGTQSITSNNDIYSPWFVESPLICDQMAVEITSNTVSGNFRIGLYAADINMQPIGAPLADSGSIVSDANGVKTYTPGSPIYLPRGRYVSVANGDTTGSGTLRVFRCSVPQGGGFSMPTTLGANGAAEMRVSRTYAAFTTPGTAWTSLTAVSSAVGFHHWVLYRVTAA